VNDDDFPLENEMTGHIQLKGAVLQKDILKIRQLLNLHFAANGCEQVISDFSLKIGYTSAEGSKISFLRMAATILQMISNQWHVPLRRLIMEKFVLAEPPVKKPVRIR